MISYIIIQMPQPAATISSSPSRHHSRVLTVLFISLFFFLFNINFPFWVQIPPDLLIYLSL